MPKIYGGLAFSDIDNDDKSYVLDIGDKRTITAGFFLPRGLEGLSVAQFEQIASAVNAFPLKLGKTIIREYSNPCPADANFTPRKLRFILNNNSSVAIPIGSKSGIVSTATTIKGVLEGVNSNIKVVCITLQGEEVPNLNVELGVNFDVSSRKPSSGSGGFYSGKIVYSSDVSGNVTAYPVKVSSANGTVPPIFGDIWSSCVGDFEDFPACGTGGRSNPVDHRRYIVQYQIEPDVARPNEPTFESRELPVNSIDATQIKNCGTLLATQTSIFCISYIGESNRNVLKAII